MKPHLKNLATKSIFKQHKSCSTISVTILLYVQLTDTIKYGNFKQHQATRPKMSKIQKKTMVTKFQ